MHTNAIVGTHLGAMESAHLFCNSLDILHSNMMFQQPMWRWTTAYSPISYGFVSNEVDILTARNRTATAYVHVPSEIFQLINLLLTDAEKAEALQDGIRFYADETDKHWVFGFEVPEGETWRDLWTYSKTKTPPWLDLALRKAR